MTALSTAWADSKETMGPNSKEGYGSGKTAPGNEDVIGPAPDSKIGGGSRSKAPAEPGI